MNQSLERKITITSLLRFTCPSIIMMIVLSLYTIVDGIFVSRLLGTDAFSAVNIVYPLLGIVIALGTMFGTGTTAIISKKMGEGKRTEANQNVTFVIVFTIIVGILIAVVSFAFLKDILYLLGANDAVYEYCHAYAMPLIFFLPANILQVQFQTLFVAAGKPGLGLTVTIAGGIANIILDYLFIAVFNMGIAGAAVATGIGYAIAAVYGLCYFTWSKKGNFHFVRPKADWHMLWNAMTNGSSEMVSNLSGSITTILFNIMMMHFIGQDGVAAIAILLYLDFVLIAVNLGYSMGVAPLFSYNYGSGNTDKIKKLYRYSVYICIIVGVIMTGGTLLFAHQLTAVFAGKGTAVYELATTGLRIYAFGYLFKGYNVFASALFTAFGNGKISAVLSFMRTLVFLVVTLVVFALIWGVNGIWSASPAAELLALAVSIYYTVKYRKKYGYR